MTSFIVTKYIPLIACTILLACQDHKLERNFLFNETAATRLDRMRKLPLEEQYRIFRYGNDRIHPPLMGLAEPIAERGKNAVPFLITAIDSESDDVSVRDVILVFQMMSAIKSYDVKSDLSLMGILRSHVSTMRDKDWKSICSKMLRDIERDQLK